MINQKILDLLRNRAEPIWRPGVGVIVVFSILISILIYTSLISPEQESEDIVISSLGELERLPQIISSERVTSDGISDAIYQIFVFRPEADILDTIVMYEIVYQTADGAEVLGFISAPADYATSGYPILINNRGGENNVIQLAVQPKHLIASASWLSLRGYIVLESFYRGGRGWVEHEKIDQFGGNDLYDVIALLDISEHFGFRGAGVFMMGSSRGGMMTYMVLRQDNRVDLAAVINAVADNVELYERSHAGRRQFRAAIGGSPDELPEEYFRRSAVNWADEIDTPLLILHGELDHVVPVSQSKRVYELMRAANRDVELIIVEDATHRGRRGARGDLQSYALDWFEARKRDKVLPPDF